MILYQVIESDPFAVKWPFKWSSDLQLGDQKVESRDVRFFGVNRIDYRWEFRDTEFRCYTKPTVSSSQAK